MVAGEKTHAKSIAASPGRVIRKIPISSDTERRRRRPYEFASPCSSCQAELTETNAWEAAWWEWSRDAGKNIRRRALLCQKCGIVAKEPRSRSD